MTIDLWKMRIDSYKNDYKEGVLDYADEVVLFIALGIFTPLILIADIIFMPLYLIGYILKRIDERK